MSIRITRFCENLIRTRWPSRLCQTPINKKLLNPLRAATCSTSTSPAPYQPISESSDATTASSLTRATRCSVLRKTTKPKETSVKNARSTSTRAYSLKRNKTANRILIMTWNTAARHKSAAVSRNNAPPYNGFHSWNWKHQPIANRYQRMSYPLQGYPNRRWKNLLSRRT